LAEAARDHATPDAACNELTSGEVDCVKPKEQEFEVRVSNQTALLERLDRGNTAGVWRLRST